MIDVRHSLFRGLADRSRLSILEHLLRGPSRVSDVVAATDLSQANASSHLACLWECGLVARERKGREVHYRLIEGVAELFNSADDLLKIAGHTIGACPTFGASARELTA